MDLTTVGLGREFVIKTDMVSQKYFYSGKATNERLDI